MRNITKLFGESPFGALEAHAEKVHECIGVLKEVFAAWEADDQERIRTLAERIFQLETEADTIRNRLHEQLATKVLLPMRKDDLFNVLEQQDSMADRAEEIAALLTYRKLPQPAHLRQEIKSYFEGVFRNCDLAAGIMSKLDLLDEAAFSGRDALSVSRLITELSEREDETKAIQIALTRKIFAAENSLSPVEVLLWMQLIGYVADLSKFADRTGNGMRLTLKIKQPR